MAVSRLGLGIRSSILYERGRNAATTFSKSKHNPSTRPNGPLQDSAGLVEYISALKVVCLSYRTSPRFQHPLCPLLSLSPRPCTWTSSRA